MAQDMKVVGVGLPRSGTTSFGDACELFGLRRLRWSPGILGPMTIQCHEGDFTLMRSVLEDYEAVEDMPWCMHYEWIIEHFPEARFVLTIRRSPEEWLQSLDRHLSRIPRWRGVELLFGTYEVAGSEDRLIEFYLSHIRKFHSVMSQNNRRYAVLTMGEPDNMRKLAHLLDRPYDESLKFPHSNRSKVLQVQNSTPAKALRSLSKARHLLKRLGR